MTDTTELSDMPARSAQRKLIEQHDALIQKDARIAELEEENKTLREALNFYSCACDIDDKRSQRCGGAHDEPFCGYVALAALKGEKG